VQNTSLGRNRARSISRRGVNLFELVFAFGILATSILLMITVFPTGYASIHKGWRINVATQIAQLEMESRRAIPFMYLCLVDQEREDFNMTMMTNGEPYTDSNNDGTWNSGESYVDYNHNGNYDGEKVQTVFSSITTITQPTDDPKLKRISVQVEWDEPDATDHVDGKTKRMIKIVNERYDSGE